MFKLQNWFRTRENKFGLVPGLSSLIKAERFVRRYHDLIQPLSSSLSFEDVKDELWQMIKYFPYKSRPLAGLPHTSYGADQVKEVGLKGYELEESTRSVEWLRGNGKCLDKIKPGKSTLAQAGRGAFATRFIPKGELVAPAPLIHIPHRENLLMYGSTSNNTRNASDIIGKQLLLNYCYGHKQSTLLLCPYSNGVNLINHDYNSPNARIVWPDSAHSIIHNSTWLNQTVDYLDEHYSNPGLEFDIVAIRDIQSNEEIFISYGKEWEEAWQEHIKDWSPMEHADEYEDASQLNCFDDEECLKVPPIRTVDEQEENPYADNFEMYCFFNDTDDRQNQDEVDEVWEAESVSTI